MRSEHRRPPTLVALHGHDDDEVKTRRWAAELAPPGWRVLTPSAPGDHGRERSWFASGPRGADHSSLAESRELITSVVAAAAANGPVVLAGFSQGAAMALAVDEIEGLRAVVGLCPFLPEADDLDLGAGAPALLLPGARDEVVPAFLGEDAGAAMAAAGREVTVATHSGGHAPAGVSIARARSWLATKLPSRMQISMGLPVDRVHNGAEFVSGDAITELAVAYEGFGIDAAYVTDHPAPDDRWLHAGGHHALEPTVALSLAMAATDTLLAHTHVYVLGYRNPFLSAKALGSLDVLSGGRLIVGVAAGYLRAEFAALGAEFDRRGEVLDETLALLPRIWSEDSVATEGPGFDARSVTALPRPAQRPHPPIWVGGNSVRAMRRAVRHAQGWSPFPTPDGLDRATRTASIATTSDLRERIDRLDELCELEGRPDRPTICFSPFSLGQYVTNPEDSLAVLAQEVAELWDLGVDWLSLTVPGTARAEVVHRVGALADALGLSR